VDNLIVQTAFLGDLVLSIPLIRQLSEIEPERGITVICRQGLGDVLKAYPFIRRVIEVNKREPKIWAEQVEQLERETFHHIICPHQSPRTALLVRRLKAQGEKVGFHRKWNFWAFTKRVEYPTHLPDALRQLSLLTAIDFRFALEFSTVAGEEAIWNQQSQAGPLFFSKVPLPIWSRLKPQAMSGPMPPSESASRTVFIAPGSVWATKRWTLTGYTEVAQRLVAKGFKVVLVGSPEEREVGEAIVNVVGEVQNAIGQWTLSQTVQEFSLAAQKGAALIANDSGAIHLAAAAQLPVVAIFGPTTLDLGFRPWLERSVVVQKPLECRPCGRHGHDRCPIGTHACMTSIAADDVLGALSSILEH
jgi:heptosyltransferase II